MINLESLNRLSTHSTDNAKLQLILFQIWLPKEMKFKIQCQQYGLCGRRIGKKSQNLQMSKEYPDLMLFTLLSPDKKDRHQLNILPISNSKKP